MDREGYHTAIMQAFCRVVQTENKPLVLKGGTALMLCYRLDRFSEDLDFDLTQPIKTHLNIESLCKSTVSAAVKNNCRVKLKDFKETKRTETTHRCRPVFDIPELGINLSIKIEISNRGVPDTSDIETINGIQVYSIDAIARQKLLAAMESETTPYRTAARDLHDLVFIATEYQAELSDNTQESLMASLADPAALLSRYEFAYESDPLLNGRIYDDLALIEDLNSKARNESHLDLFRG